MTTKSSSLLEIDKKYNLREFVEAPATQSEVDQIGLESIDLSGYVEGPEGLETRQKLAKQLEKALTVDGFFKLIGHGIPESHLQLLRSVGQSIAEIPEEEKRNFVGGTQWDEQEKDVDLGVIRGPGFKPRGYFDYGNEVKDNVEFYNVRYFLHKEIFYNKIKYPEFVGHHLDDIAEYLTRLHNTVLRKILTLVDIILELPEGYFWDNFFKVVENDLDNSGGGVGRFIYYHKVDEEYKRKTNGTWLRGHSDQGAFTFIVSQSILALQIRDHITNEWKYVSHTPNSLIVNVGDSITFLTGGYFKSALHRVVLPPKDQEGYNRGTVIYFSNVSSNTIIDTKSVNSPKLQRLNFETSPDLERITFKQWDNTKGKFFNKTSKTNRNSGGIKLLGRQTLMSYVDSTPVGN